MSSIFECRFILSHRLFFRLSFIVGEHAANSLLIPASREIALLHLLPFRRRRRRYAIDGLPRRSYYHEHTLGLRVRHIGHAEVTSRSGLAQSDA